MCINDITEDGDPIIDDNPDRFVNTTREDCNTNIFQGSEPRGNSPSAWIVDDDTIDYADGNHKEGDKLTIKRGISYPVRKSPTWNQALNLIKPQRNPTNDIIKTQEHVMHIEFHHHIFVSSDG